MSAGGAHFYLGTMRAHIPSRTAWMRAAAASALAMLGGCNMVVMNPTGDVARQQANLIIISTGLMLLIIIPVLVLVVAFAWKYRHTNEDAEYKPDWDHSTMLELVIWSAPLMIVIALGALTWVSTHLLDPYRPLDQIARGTPVPKGQKPLEIQVVSLDWKWLFIYPEQGIATVNALALPTDRQVKFRMTSANVMNAFYVPTMAGMIYTMPGMETSLHAVLNKAGRFEGRSANYSGAGFSYMNFPVQAIDGAGFDAWAAQMRAQGQTLNAAMYQRLEQPSEKVPMMRFASVEPGLFDKVVQMCVTPGQACQTMQHGEGHGAPINNTRRQGEGETKGAIFKDPGDKGSSPHMSKDTAPNAADGKKKSAEPTNNRNMTMLRTPALPGAVVGMKG